MKQQREYEVLIEETLQKRIAISAESACEAVERVTKQYKNNTHVLDAGHWVDTVIKIVE